MKHKDTVFVCCAVATISCAQGFELPVSRDAAPLSGRLDVWMEKAAGYKINVDKDGVILKGYDVVAYFTQNRAVKGNSQYPSTYQGAKYYFSSLANRALFAKSPAKYIPQYGAFCADGLVEGKLEDIDPKVFFIRQGKLYFCSSAAELKSFRANEEEDVVTANRNWLQLGH
jgi:YHS domain-containing protein